MNFKDKSSKNKMVLLYFYHYFRIFKTVLYIVVSLLHEKYAG